MLTKTLSEVKKKQRASLIKAMNNDIGSIDSAKDSWNPAQISERAKNISYIRSLVDSWNPAQLNEALKMLDLPVIDTWNPAQIEEQRRNLVFYLAERTLTGNPITLKILGNLTPEVTNLKVTMNPIQDLHGYSNPWAGGAGKNILNTNVFNDTEYFEINSDGSITQKKADGRAENSMQTLHLSAGTYIFSRGSTNGTCKVYGLINGSWVTFVNNTNESTTITLSEACDLYIKLSTNGTFPAVFYPMITLSTVTDQTFAPYSNICPISGRTEASVTRTAGEDVETKTHEYNETIWWGEDDFKNGGMEVIGAEIASYDGETLSGEWMSDRDVYAPDTTPTTGAQVVYKNTPTTIETTPEEITLLKGTNVLSTDGDFIELKYKQNF